MAGLGALALQLLSRYLVQILAGLALVALYFVWAGHQQDLGKAKVEAAVAKRDAGEKAQSDKLWNEAVTNVAKARQEDQNNFDGILKAYAKILSERGSHSKPITVVGVRDNKPAGAKSDNCPPAGQTDVPQGSFGADGRTSEEVPELARLCLLAADEIRRTHVIK